VGGTIISRNGLISVYVIFALVTAGFIGLLVFEGILDKPGVTATTRIVDINGGGSYTKIQDAINASNNGDTIRVWAGSYREYVIVNRTVSLIGNGSANTIINGGFQTNTVTVYSDWVNITGFSINNSIEKWNSHYGGLKLSIVKNCHIYNNSFYNNMHGIIIDLASNNKIDNNTINGNNGYGMYIFSAGENNLIYSNSICYNDYYGIKVYNADSNSFVENTIQNNSDIGIIFDYADTSIIKNNNISGNRAGIMFSRSIKSTAMGNDFHFNDGVDISLSHATSITLQNNRMYSYGVVVGGNILSNWTSHSIDTTNKIHGKPVIYWKNVVGGTVPAGAGQVILGNCKNVIVKGQNCSVASYGLTMGFSDNNVIRNNLFNDCRYQSMNIENSDYNTIENNQCNNSRMYGSIIRLSEYNNISKNNFINNSDYGIMLTLSLYNNIEYNNISYNRIGLHFVGDAEFNEIYNNTISRNTQIGIDTQLTTDNNRFYHNAIIANKAQEVDSGSNFWDKNEEGNYWSDYTGLDDGSGLGKHAISGDGIGDTNVPHRGLDNYPFLKPFSWLNLDDPLLSDPGELSYDGNYSMSWSWDWMNYNSIFEESTTSAFDNPDVSQFPDSNTTSFINKPNGTYHYRVKTSCEYFNSEWSNVANITVDWPPSTPENLSVQKTDENLVTLSWDLNPEPDIGGYDIYINETGAGSSGPFRLLTTVSSSTSKFEINNFTDETTYYFKLKTFDKILSYSGFTSVVSITTYDITPPSAPFNLEAVEKSDTEIELTWEFEPVYDLEGFQVFMNDSGEEPTGNYSLIADLNVPSTTYTATGLSEQTVYYFKLLAYDEIPHYSSYSNIASAVTPDINKPSIPLNLFIRDPTPSSLTLEWDENPENDIVGYNIYRTESIHDLFVLINPDPFNSTVYLDDDLNESTTFYYIISAVDDAGLESDYSTMESGITLFGPHAPDINKPVSDLELAEDTIDDRTIKLNEWFIDQNKDPLIFGYYGSIHIAITIFENGSVMVAPDANWSGLEVITFYAVDKDGNTSFSINITITPINDAPWPVEIVSPLDGDFIKVGDTIDLKGNYFDADIPYGDEHSVRWLSNITGQLGEGTIVNGVMLIAGVHKITFKIKDRDGLVTEDSIMVTVYKELPDDITDAEPKNEQNQILTMLAILAIVAVIVVLLVFLMLRKNKKPAEEEKIVSEPTAPVYQEPIVETEQASSAEPIGAVGEYQYTKPLQPGWENIPRYDPAAGMIIQEIE
jgi:parallel beta-helix repeat protein